jgi:hypothetical protein
MNDSSSVEPEKVGKVRFNEFDALLDTEEENEKIKNLYTLKDANKKIRVVFLKGFSVGINWTDTVEKDDIKVEERHHLEPNSLINQRCLGDAIDNICNSVNKELLIVWDGDNYDKGSFTYVIPELLKKLNSSNITYKLIAYRSSQFEEFKTSWTSCSDIDTTEINIIKSPLISGNHYEDLAIFGREKTASFLNMSNVSSICIFCFGGGVILEAELTPRLPFETTEIMMYNVTRIRGQKPNMYFQRNYIFKDTKYIDGDSIVLGKYFRIKKDERAICQIENDNALRETLVNYSKNTSGKGTIRIFERYANRKIQDTSGQSPEIKAVSRRQPQQLLTKTSPKPNNSAQRSRFNTSHKTSTKKYQKRSSKMTQKKRSQKKRSQRSSKKRSSKKRSQKKRSHKRSR